MSHFIRKVTLAENTHKHGGKQHEEWRKQTTATANGLFHRNGFWMSVS